MLQWKAEEEREDLGAALFGRGLASHPVIQWIKKRMDRSGQDEKDTKRKQAALREQEEAQWRSTSSWLA